MRAVVFDLDDTLYPREQFVRSGFAAVARHVESRWGVASVSAFLTLCRATLSGRRGQEFQALCETTPVPSDAMEELLQVFRGHAPRLSLPATSRAVLGHLRRAGWRVGVLTNGPRAVQARKVEALGLAGLVDAVVYATDHADGGKPAPAAFAAVLTALGGVPAGRAVCVGDDVRCDIHGARAAGLHTIRVVPRGGRGAVASDADVVVDRLDEVAAIAPALVGDEARHAA